MFQILKKIFYTLLPARSGRGSEIAPEAKKVYSFLTETMFESGRRPSLEEIAEHTDLPVKGVKWILYRFEKAHGIYREPVYKQVIAAYPLAGIPTVHKLIKPEGGRVAYSPCAMDAVTLPPTLGRDLEVRSSCRYCDARISLKYEDEGSRIAERTPDDIWLWVEDRRSDRTNYYPIVCINTNFFCSREHLEDWLEEETEERIGRRYSVDDAFAARETWCSYELYKYIVEGRPWQVAKCGGADAEA